MASDEETTAALLSSDPPELLASSSHFAVGVWGPALVALWRGEATVARTLELECLVRQTVERHRIQLFLQIVEPTSPVPSAEVRAISTRITREFLHRLTAAAHIVEGDSLRVQLVRTILRATSLVLQGRVPQRFFASAELASEWLAAALEPTPGPARTRLQLGLAAAVVWIRAHVDAEQRSDGLVRSSSPSARTRGLDS